MNTAKLGILSPTSTCHTFDATADGYGRAEGAGALYLKRLSDAIRDGDPIRGLIRSSAVNTYVLLSDWISVCANMLFSAEMARLRAWGLLILA